MRKKIASPCRFPIVGGSGRQIKSNSLLVYRLCELSPFWFISLKEMTTTTTETRWPIPIHVCRATKQIVQKDGKTKRASKANEPIPGQSILSQFRRNICSFFVSCIIYFPNRTIDIGVSMWFCVKLYFLCCWIENSHQLANIVHCFVLFFFFCSSMEKYTRFSSKFCTAHKTADWR